MILVLLDILLQMNSRRAATVSLTKTLAHKYRKVVVCTGKI